MFDRTPFADTQHRNCCDTNSNLHTSSQTRTRTQITAVEAIQKLVQYFFKCNKPKTKNPNLKIKKKCNKLSLASVCRPKPLV